LAVKPIIDKCSVCGKGPKNLKCHHPDDKYKPDAEKRHVCASCCDRILRYRKQGITRDLAQLHTPQMNRRKYPTKESAMDAYRRLPPGMNRSQIQKADWSLYVWLDKLGVFPPWKKQKETKKPIVQFVPGNNKSNNREAICQIEFEKFELMKEAEFCDPLERMMLKEKGTVIDLDPSFGRVTVNFKRYRNATRSFHTNLDIYKIKPLGK
jgi:hypothetical protein